ncbi:MAG: acyltransferase [Planctomycetia bacterium]|nr:acyltransferase [Planctomycetia bacterium]
MAVILSHSFLLVDGDEADEPLWKLTGTTIGTVVVDLFLIISGFLVSHSLVKSKTIKEFILKRVLRVYPAFLILSAIQAFVLAPLASEMPFTGYSARQWGIIAFNMIDLVGYGFPYGGLLSTFENNPYPGVMNGSLWTIRYEFVCYVFLAMAAKSLRKISVCIAVFTLLWLWYFSGFRLSSHWIVTAIIGDVFYLPRFFTFFMAGVLFHRLRNRIPYSNILAAVGAATIVGVAVVRPDILEPVLSIAGTYLLLWIAYQPELVRLLGDVKADYSYGVYLYGFPVQQSLLLWASPYVAFGPYGLTVCASAIALVLGAASWHGVEKWFVAMKQRNSSASH